MANQMEAEARRNNGAEMTNKPITSEEIGELERLLEKATPGRWHKHNKVGYVYGEDCVVARCGDFHDKELTRFNADRWNADAALIATMRNALPRLLSSLRGGREEAIERAKYFAQRLRVAKFVSDEEYLPWAREAAAYLDALASPSREGSSLADDGEAV